MSSPMTYVSYYECSLEDGRLLGSLGSGPIKDIFSRSHTDPSIRVCMQEPADEAVRFRVRCGLAEVRPSGLVDVSQHDATQQRGASVQMLPVGQRVWALLRRHGTVSTPISTALASGWLEVDGDAMKACDSERAWEVMSDPAAALEKRVFVRFGGEPDQVAYALNLLGDELDSAT